MTSKRPGRPLCRLTQYGGPFPFPAKTETRESALENKPLACLHVMRVTPFVASLTSEQQQQQQPWRRPRLSRRDTLVNSEPSACGSHASATLSVRADRGGPAPFAVAGLPLWYEEHNQHLTAVPHMTRLFCVFFFLLFGSSDNCGNALAPSLRGMMQRCSAAFDSV